MFEVLMSLSGIKTLVKIEGEDVAISFDRGEQQHFSVSEASLIASAILAACAEIEEE